MKQNSKEKLYDKSRKMIDLAYDEVKEGGVKDISASFVDSKTSLKYSLSVTLTVKDDDSPYINPSIIPSNGEDDEL